MITQDSDKQRNELENEVNKDDREPITLTVFAIFFIIAFGMLILTS